MFFSAISIKAYRCGLNLFISVETLHFQGASRYCCKNQSANTDGGTPPRDAQKEIRKKRSVGHFKLTGEAKRHEENEQECLLIAPACVH